MEVDTVSLDEVTLAREAFRLAHGRFVDAHAARDTQHWYAALGETLFWIAALDHHYQLRARRTGRIDAYFAHRDPDLYGRCIGGLIFARNAAGHQIAILLEPPATSESALLGQLRWRRASDLPKPDRAVRGELRLSYTTLLEGNAARYGLRRANYYFIRRQNLLDSSFPP
jgi:hypothetical protein